VAAPRHEARGDSYIHFDVMRLRRTGVLIGLAASVARTLIPARLAWVWGVLLGCSIRSMWGWVLQGRGDFPGIGFELLAEPRIPNG
jgi:hypothetical protein